MQGQGNYSIQVGQDPYARPRAFQQHPETAVPSTSHYGPLPPQSHVMQHGHPSFHLRPGGVAYQHALTSVPHLGQPAPVASVGMNSAQSYLHLPRPQQISNQGTRSYPIIEQQPLAWSQNVHQLPPSASLQGQSAYQLAYSQHTFERGLSHQPPPHAPPPPPPLPYSSSSTVLISGPGGSSVIPVREHSYQQSMAPVLPPPPPLPPSPSRVPPLRPSSPSSDIHSKEDENLSMKGPPDGYNMTLECPPPLKPVDATSMGLVVAEAAQSLTDSDMDMEDDITYPYEERKNFVSANSNDECGSMSQEDYTGEKLQPLQHTGGHRIPEVFVNGNVSSVDASLAKTKGGGSEVASNCNFTVAMKPCGQNGNSFDASIKESPLWQENIGQSGGPLIHPETGHGELPHQLMEGANPLENLQGYCSTSTSENGGEDIGDVGFPSNDDAPTKSYVEKDFVSDLTHKSLSESNKHLLPVSLTVSPRNVMDAGKLTIPTRKMEESSDRSHRGQEQSKDSSRNYDKNTGLEEANLQKPDIKSDKLKVDEFGRLVREDVSDSDTSDSPSYARWHAKRAQKRSRSQSRSHSPHDRRKRRRSPLRRKERRGRSRCLSPRRRSRSRSPVLRSDAEFGRDKLRQEKDQLLECFDFLQGKCYRGTNCRYSHHESDKNARSRFKMGKQHHRDALPNLRSSDKEGEVATEKEIKDKGGRTSQDMHGLREVKAEKGLPDDSTSELPDKIDNLSVCPNLETPSAKHNYLTSETAAKYSAEIPQFVDRQGKRAYDSLLSESFSLRQALGSTPTHHPADSAKQNPTSQLYSVDSYSIKPYSNQEVPSQSLKELLPSIANHPFQLSIPLPSASQPVSASFAQPVLQDYSLNPPISKNRLIPEKCLTNETSVAYKHSHFPGPLKSLSSSPFPIVAPPIPTSVEHSIPQHLQQSSQPSWNGLFYTSMRNQPTEMPIRSQTGEYQAYPFAREHDKILHRTDGFGSSSLNASNLTSREGVSHTMGEDHVARDPIRSCSSSKSFSMAQTNLIPRQSSIKGIHSSLGVGLSSDNNPSHGGSYFQQTSYGQQYSAGGDGYAGVAEPGIVSSSASRITQDFPEVNAPYVRGLVGSKISNYFNPYASTFDFPLSSKFSSNTLVRENDVTTYGMPVGSSSGPIDLHRIGSVGSKNMISSSFVLPAECVSRPVGNQYDPLFDSIEPTSGSIREGDHSKHEITGDSDDLLRFHGSGRLLDPEAVKQEGERTVSSNDSLRKEECGETADVAVGAVLNRTPSDPNDAIDMNAEEFEIDQIKTSGKKKKSKERSTKHFKISIAAFVKEVLKPSWRQGNMSKEAFKTIVKKTVDKVSGAMKSHQIPKSQAKINHYIDSSRGKLTKLVMGYVDKYVKV